MVDESKQRLGRGLAALIGDFDDETAALERARGQRLVPIEFLRPNPRNPRKSFHEAELEDLSNSVRERGIIQPILVRTIAGFADTYEIVAGERRWRAAQRTGLHEVPIVLVEAGDKEALEIAIIENVQRSDLNALEEAHGYSQLGTEFGYSQAELARVIGKSRSHVANTLRLLKLSPKVQHFVETGELSAGHARALLTMDHPESLAKRIVSQGMSVRDVEKIAQLESERKLSSTEGGDSRAKAVKMQKDSDTIALEKALTDALGLTVVISHRAGRGEMSIRYKSLDQLDALCKRLQAA